MNCNHVDDIEVFKYRLFDKHRKIIKTIKKEINVPEKEIIEDGKKYKLKNVYASNDAIYSEVKNIL